MINNFMISYYLPETIVTNDNLRNEFSDLDPERVLDQTGICRRHYTDSLETASDLAVKACEKLFTEYGIDRSCVDFLIYVTQCQDYKLPATACILQNRLSLKKTCGAFDINLGCSGFTYALSVARGLIKDGSASNILILTADNLSRYTGSDDRSLKILIGDGGAACLINENTVAHIGKFIFGTDGSGFGDIIIEAGGEKLPVSAATKERIKNPFSDGFITKENLNMNGINVFTFAITTMPAIVGTILKKNDLEKSDVNFYVFHQANKTILEYLQKKIGANKENFYINLKETGNTSSCTIPIALKMAEDEGRLKHGMKTVILGFGVGLSWCGTVIEW